MTGTPAPTEFISPLNPRSMEVLRGERSALLVAAEGCGKTTLAEHFIRNTAPTLGAHVLLDATVTSVFETIWLAMAGRIRELFETDPQVLARAAKMPHPTGVALRMVAEHARREGYDLDTWFYLRGAAGIGDEELRALRAALERVPAHVPMQSCTQLVEEITCCRDATRLREQNATLWIEVAPSFDWTKHGSALAEFASRRQVRGSGGITIKLLIRPSDEARVADCGIASGDLHKEVMMWGLEALVDIADQATDRWLSRFRGTPDGERRLQALYDEALENSRRRLAASPKCWASLAQILRDRQLLRIVEERDWHFAIRDCCAATRKLSITTEGVFVGGDRIDVRGMLTLTEQLVLRVIQEHQQVRPPSAGEIASFINNHRGGNRTATHDSIPRVIHALRSKPFFEPVFHLRAPNAASRRAEYDPDYLVYLHNDDSGHQYRLRNMV